MLLREFFSGSIEYFDYDIQHIIIIITFFSFFTKQNFFNSIIIDRRWGDLRNYPAYEVEPPNLQQYFKKLKVLWMCSFANTVFIYTK